MSRVEHTSRPLMPAHRIFFHLTWSTLARRPMKHAGGGVDHRPSRQRGPGEVEENAVGWHEGAACGFDSRHDPSTISQRGLGSCIPTLKSGPSETLRLKRSALSGPRLRRGNPTRKNGPWETLRLKRSAVSGPRLWRGNGNEGPSRLPPACLGCSHSWGVPTLEEWAQ